jgi:hypothetical protein
MYDVESVETHRKRIALKSKTFINDIIIEKQYRLGQYFADHDRDTYTL